MAKGKPGVGTDAKRSDGAGSFVADANHSAGLSDARAEQQELELNVQPNASIDEAIRELAYRKWEASGRTASDGIEFWLEAEREICDANIGHGNSIEKPSE